MSRTLKFRAWDKNDQIMYQVAELVMSDGGIDWNAKGDHAIQGWRGEAEFMQYTGLLDKNGKEIYEGDIVKLPHYTGPVEWDEYGYRFDPLSYMANTSENTNRQLEEIEIIGNIYENPELVK